MARVDLEVRDGVAVVTLHNPPVRNAITEDMAASVVALCDQVDADTSVGAMILTGANEDFCTGADTKEWEPTKRDPAHPARVRASDLMYGSFQRVGAITVPTISAIKGWAIGAGLNLAMSTDVRVVADDARLRSGFIQAGISPGGGHFSLIGRTSSRDVGAALGLFGQDLSGTEAARIGFAWRAVPSEDLLELALDMGRQAAKDPELSRRVVQTFRNEFGPPTLPWDVAVELERGAQMWSFRRKGLAEES